MKLLEILRKLGILRFGATAGTYSSAKDAPKGLAGDEFFDSVEARKDKEDNTHPQ